MAITQDLDQDGSIVSGMESEEFDVIVVGGGAAGIGVGVSLLHAGVENFLIVERESLSLIHI